MGRNEDKKICPVDDKKVCPVTVADYKTIHKIRLSYLIGGFFYLKAVYS